MIRIQVGFMDLGNILLDGKMDILGFDPINQLPDKCSGKRKILEENIFSFFDVR
ncbi:MAG: hypothetical protein JNL51_07145 [Chitinophagaceae bacterium]|nr:hypothetical protein [Chitinophagaceae bacterium]